MIAQVHPVGDDRFVIERFRIWPMEGDPKDVFYHIIAFSTCRRMLASALKGDGEEPWFSQEALSDWTELEIVQRGVEKLVWAKVSTHIFFARCVGFLGVCVASVVDGSRIFDALVIDEEAIRGAELEECLGWLVRGDVRHLHREVAEHINLANLPLSSLAAYGPPRLPHAPSTALVEQLTFAILRHEGAHTFGVL